MLQPTDVQHAAEAAPGKFDAGETIMGHVANSSHEHRTAGNGWLTRGFCRGRYSSPGRRRGWRCSRGCHLGRWWGNRNGNKLEREMKKQAQNSWACEKK